MKDGANQGGSSAEEIGIDEQLITEGTEQLLSEIQVLENWLKELDNSRANDTDSIAARKSYNDMLQSRREMLSSLSRRDHNLSGKTR
ncbi:MAG: hypothetical protein WDZ76_08285 [Pseudohongiellaceae bacterium]